MHDTWVRLDDGSYEPQASMAPADDQLDAEWQAFIDATPDDAAV